VIWTLHDQCVNHVVSLSWIVMEKFTLSWKHDANLTVSRAWKWGHGQATHILVTYPPWLMCEPRRVSLGTSMAIEKLILSQKHCEQHSSPEKQYLCLAFISFHLGQDTRGPLVEQELLNLS